MNSLILETLATWRLTSLFVQEEGPFELFEHIRQFVGVKEFNELDQLEQDRVYGCLMPFEVPPEIVANNVIAKALTCTWCFSMWISALITLIRYRCVNLNIILRWLALSTGAIIIDSIANREG